LNFYLDDLIQRINEWEKIFLREYNSNEKINFNLRNNLNEEEEEEIEDNCCGSSKSRFDLSLKLFYLTLENILRIEKQRLIHNKLDNQHIQQVFQ